MTSGSSSAAGPRPPPPCRRCARRSHAQPGSSASRAGSVARRRRRARASPASFPSRCFLRDRSRVPGRELEHHGCTAAGGPLDPDPTTVREHDRSGDRQAETAAARCIGSGHPKLRERLERAIALLPCDSRGLSATRTCTAERHGATETVTSPAGGEKRIAFSSRFGRPDRSKPGRPGRLGRRGRSSGPAGPRTWARGGAGRPRRSRRAPWAPSPVAARRSAPARAPGCCRPGGSADRSPRARSAELLGLRWSNCTSTCSRLVTAVLMDARGVRRSCVTEENSAALAWLLSASSRAAAISSRSWRARGRRRSGSPPTRATGGPREGTPRGQGVWR